MGSREETWGQGDREGARKSEGRGNCGRNVLYERRNLFSILKEKRLGTWGGPVVMDRLRPHPTSGRPQLLCDSRSTGSLIPHLAILSPAVHVEETSGSPAGRRQRHRVGLCSCPQGKRHRVVRDGICWKRSTSTLPACPAVPLAFAIEMKGLKEELQHES